MNAQAGFLNQFDPLLLLFLGWLLGLLSPVIQERIRRTYRRSELLSAIRSELSTHQYRMALVAWMMRAKIVNMPDEFAAWIVKATKNYRGPEYSPNILTMVSMAAQQPRATREAALKLLSDPTKGKSLKEYALPVFEAHRPELSSFPLRVQEAVLQVIVQTDLYNQHVRFLQGQFDKTFSCPADQYEIIAGNLNKGYLELAEIAQRIADAIDHVPQR